MSAVQHPRRPGFAGPLSASAWGGRLPWRAVALLVAVLLAYNYSLQTLARGITLQSPLGYLALVPIIALALAWIRLAREPAPLPIHDRQVDYIVGLTLLAIAAGIAIGAPEAMTFWLDRIDLLGLPFFVAGLIALLYGVRRVWALKFPILFLFLAWPVPYAPLVGEGMEAFTNLTVSVVGALSSWITTAKPMPNDPTVFAVGSDQNTFFVSIGSACAGVNSLVGFLIVGGAFSYAVRGPALRRIAWLVGGLAVIWLLNIVRIEGIFAIGAAFGEDAAIDVLHPFAGLIVFNLGVLAMLAAIRPMGLHFMELGTIPDGALKRGAPISRVRVPVAIAAALAVSLGVVNAGYARFETISSDLGNARLQPFDHLAVAAPGWVLSEVGEYDQVRQYFGQTATWNRVRYLATDGATVHADRPVYVDVINTGDAGALAEFGLVDCYVFHGYTIEANTEIDLGYGLTGQILDYHNPKTDSDWSAISWEWPYANGDETAYERIVVFLSGGPKAEYRGTDPSAPMGGAARFETTDRFLVTMARTMIESHLKRTGVPV
jgi:exosortase